MIDIFSRSQPHISNPFIYPVTFLLISEAIFGYGPLFQELNSKKIGGSVYLTSEQS